MNDLGIALTQVNSISTEFFQACLTGLLAILARAIHTSELAILHENPELRRKEYLISFASALEPLAQHFFTCTINADVD